jgi:hypothetical protein
MYICIYIYIYSKSRNRKHVTVHSPEKVFDLGYYISALLIPQFFFLILANGPSSRSVNTLDLPEVNNMHRILVNTKLLLCSNVDDEGWFVPPHRK